MTIQRFQKEVDGIQLKCFDSQLFYSSNWRGIFFLRFWYLYIYTTNHQTMIKKHFLTRVSLKEDDIESYDEFPLSLPFLKDFEGLNFHPQVTFIVGENGSGKSTFLEGVATAWGFNPEGGSINFSFSTVASHSNLDQYLRLAKGMKRPRGGFFLRAESFYNVASEIDELAKEPNGQGFIDQYGGKSLHEQSHGESFLSLFMHRFRGESLYILDEPEAALSPQRQMSFVARLHELVKSGAQFIIATHSPIIMSYPNAEIYQIDGDRFDLVNYEETSHFTVTRDFLNNHQMMLKQLMS